MDNNFVRKLVEGILERFTVNGYVHQFMEFDEIMLSVEDEINTAVKALNIPYVLRHLDIIDDAVGPEFDNILGAVLYVAWYIDGEMDTIYVTTCD